MKETILVVDDEEDLRYVLTRQLLMGGFQVDTASDGEEAIQKLREREYPVIVTDMKMPRKDGLSVIQAAHELHPETEIIVLTGHGTLENALQAFKAGNIFEYLLKPLDDIAVLNTIVERALERRNLRRHNRLLFEQLQQAYEELKRKSEALIQNEKMSAIGQLAAGVAHELNNPLTAVLGFAQIIHEKLKGKRPENWSDAEYGRLMQALENMMQGVYRSREIVSTLLRFARHTRPEQRSLVNINQVLSDTFVFTEHVLLRHGIVLQKQLAPELPPVWGNASRLQQVFTNLLINAQQATPAGGTITVISEPSDDPKGVWVYVEDTGEGIPPDALEHIFEPFYTRKEEGTGLGLSIARQVVLEHHGQIHVTSEVGKGTRFSIFLPAAEAEQLSPPYQEDSSPEAKSA
ncbi:MAG: ATP-binding protein [Armatimonadota bacterium]